MRCGRRAKCVDGASTAALQSRDVTQRCSPSAIIALQFSIPAARSTRTGSQAQRVERGSALTQWPGERRRVARTCAFTMPSRGCHRRGIGLVCYVCSHFGHFLEILQSSLINVLTIQCDNKWTNDLLIQTFLNRFSLKSTILDQIYRCKNVSVNG